MASITEQEVLDNAYDFFFDFFSKKAQNYSNKKYKSFKVNPFTIQATANAFGSPITINSLAKAVVYPFALGTSIATSFGTNFQAFMVSTTGGLAKASVVKGMDIEYDDALDSRHKYCQIKSGPTTINKDDIKTIEDHFKGLTNLARTNQARQGGQWLIGLGLDRKIRQRPGGEALTAGVGVQIVLADDYPWPAFQPGEAVFDREKQLGGRQQGT